MSRMPTGRQGEGGTKGYSGGYKSHRGRQLGRVMATRYREVVVEHLYLGKIQLESSLQQLIRAASQVLMLTADQKPRIIVRMDGGGRDVDINCY